VTRQCETPTFRERVLALVRLIPPGRVATYGQLALLAGRPRSARQVGTVLRGLKDDDGEVPWQRVVNADGKLSTYKVGAGELQRALLEAEGVRFDRDGRCDLRRLRWPFAD
jgi:methylated-DNA-protein-cysteine methyltransferase-like protein